MHDVKHNGWGLIRFIRLLYEETMAQLEEMKTLDDGVHLNDQEDVVR
jgi:hypothetical protein